MKSRKLICNDAAMLLLLLLVGCAGPIGPAFPFLGPDASQALALILFIAVVIALVRVGATKSFRSQDSSIEILKQRYARGELTTEQFRATLAELADVAQKH